MTPITFVTGSAVVALEPRTEHFRDAVLDAAGAPEVIGIPAVPDLVLAEAAPDRHDRAARTTAMPVTRGVTREPDGTVVLASAGGSGYRQRWQVGEDSVRVESQWAPSAKESLAARGLPSRFRALRAQVLLHHPVLWWASLDGLAPLHVSVVEVGGTNVLLAGPGGVGKTSLVVGELAAGARATCDNLAVSDGSDVFGLREPLRVPAESAGRRTGPRAAHGRREQRWRQVAPSLRPDVVVVVRRDGGTPGLAPVDRDSAHRALVAGTMAAGELMRFWPLAAVLGLATGRGPVLPPVDDVARTLVDRLPCHELRLGDQPGERLHDLLADLVGSAEVAR